MARCQMGRCRVEGCHPERLGMVLGPVRLLREERLGGFRLRRELGENREVGSFGVVVMGT
jgi:hypothetical protein